KEDEEFLAQVGTHSALAVENVRLHEAAVAQARRDGAASVLKTAQQFLAPHEWPETPGFESAPLRWRSEELNLVSYAVMAADGRIAFLLLESALPADGAFGALLKAGNAGKAELKKRAAADAVERALAADPACSASAAVWEKDRIELAAGGQKGTIPYLLRDGRPVPFPLADRKELKTAQSATLAGDVLVLISTGLSALQFPGKHIPPEK